MLSKYIHLPLEVICLILDHLLDDKPTISNCSTVCQSWKSSCHRRLFRRLVVRCGNFRGKSYVFQDFLGFLTASPQICEYIEGLFIWGNGDRNPSRSFIISSHDFRQLLKLLKNIHSLRLSRVVMSSLGEQVDESMEKFNINFLHMDSIIWDQEIAGTSHAGQVVAPHIFRSREFIHFLGFFSHIHHLDFHPQPSMVDLPLSDEELLDITSSAQNSLTIHTLNVYPDKFVRMYLSIFPRLIARNSLRSLTVLCWGFSERACLADILRFGRSTIRDVTIQINSTSDERTNSGIITSGYWNDLGLNQCDHLESVGLSLCLSTRTSPLDRSPLFPFRELLAILNSQVPPSNLTKLTLLLPIGSGRSASIFEALKSLDWVSFNDVLVKKFRKLEMVHFELKAVCTMQALDHARMYFDEVTNMLKEKLGKLLEKGTKVEFQFERTIISSIPHGGLLRQSAVVPE